MATLQILSSSLHKAGGSFAGGRGASSRQSVSFCNYNGIGAYGGFSQDGDCGTGYCVGDYNNKFCGASFGTGAGFGSGAGFGGGLGYAGVVSMGQGGSFGDVSSLLSINKKMTMQNLNDRLASYLDKVRELEEANTELETKIKEWYNKQRPVSSEGSDYSHYFKTIDDIRGKILSAQVENNKIILAIDNSRLTSDDFKLKYENEHVLCQSVEGDVNGLRRLLDELTLSKSDLESQMGSLIEELNDLKKNHEEEMKTFQGQAMGSVSVEMDAAPGTDLSKVLADMRADYEKMAVRYQQQAEERFVTMTKDLQKQVAANVQETKSSKSEITSLRSTNQTMEIELHTQLSMKSALETSLTEAEGRYCVQLSKIQDVIVRIENEISAIRNQLENQNSEYKLLLDIKTRLEQEIAKYQELLSAQDSKIPVSAATTDSSSTVTATSTTSTKISSTRGR